MRFVWTSVPRRVLQIFRIPNQTSTCTVLTTPQQTATQTNGNQTNGIVNSRANDGSSFPTANLLNMSSTFASMSPVRLWMMGFITASLISIVAKGALSVSTLTSVAIPSSSKNFICVGGSSGMGKAAALECLMQGGNVLLISRSEDKLSSAKDDLMLTMVANQQTPANGVDKTKEIDGDEHATAALSSSVAIGERIQTVALDVADEAAVEEFATNQLKDSYYDALVITACGKAPHGPMLTLPTQMTREMLETKVWTAYHCAKYFSPRLRDGGAVIFVAGILNRRPGVNCVPLAMANGALEALTRSLALEWGPRLRVNCLSPGFCDTERFDHMPPDKKVAMLANTAASLPLQKVGKPVDMGQALYYLATASFCTGVVLDVDGGHMIRQYASASTDPMRTKSTNP